MTKGINLSTLTAWILAGEVLSDGHVHCVLEGQKAFIMVT